MPNNNKIISPRALVSFGAAPILAEREASRLAPGSAKCEADASRRQRRRYLMIHSQLLPGSRRALRFRFRSLLFRAPALRRPVKRSHRLTRDRVWETPWVRKSSQQGRTLMSVPPQQTAPPSAAHPSRESAAFFFILFFLLSTPPSSRPPPLI